MLSPEPPPDMAPTVVTSGNSISFSTSVSEYAVISSREGFSPSKGSRVTVACVLDISGMNAVPLETARKILSARITIIAINTSGLNLRHFLRKPVYQSIALSNTLFFSFFFFSLPSILPAIAGTSVRATRRLAPSV